MKFADIDSIQEQLSELLVKCEGLEEDLAKLAQGRFVPDQSSDFEKRNSDTGPKSQMEDAA